MIVRELRERGFRFVQVSELMARRRPPPGRADPAGAVELPAPVAPLPAAPADGPIPARHSPSPEPRRRRSDRQPGRAKIVRASPGRARQAAWIAGIEPWRGLGYRAAPLGRYLARLARTGDVWVARARRPGAHGAAARRSPSSSRRMGFCWAGSSPCSRSSRRERAGPRAAAGRARRGARLRPRRRWLFVSCDADNRAALRFYRRLGFARVGRLPDLVRAAAIELLLRKPIAADAADVCSGPCRVANPHAMRASRRQPRLARAKLTLRLSEAEYHWARR